jgi:hypothetical protein
MSEVLLENIRRSKKNQRLVVIIMQNYKKKWGLSIYLQSTAVSHDNVTCSYKSKESVA